MDVVSPTTGRGQLAFVEKEPNGWHSWIADEGGHVIDEVEIQRARLADAL